MFPKLRSFPELTCLKLPASGDWAGVVPRWPSRAARAAAAAAAAAEGATVGAEPAASASLTELLHKACSTRSAIVVLNKVHHNFPCSIPGAPLLDSARFTWLGSRCPHAAHSGLLGRLQQPLQQLKALLSVQSLQQVSLPQRRSYEACTSGAGSDSS